MGTYLSFQNKNKKTRDGKSTFGSTQKKKKTLLL
jgi:hypothetical protein